MHSLKLVNTVNKLISNTVLRNAWVDLETFIAKSLIQRNVQRLSIMYKTKRKKVLNITAKRRAREESPDSFRNRTEAPGMQINQA